MDSRKVLVRDNGLRCFIPPCFSWDVVDQATGATIDVVSDIDLAGLGLSADEESRLDQAIRAGQRVVKGHTRQTGPIPPSGQKGRTLVVEGVE